MATKELSEKFFDVRTVKRYLKAGTITEQDVTNHLKNIPNDEENFELSLWLDDDLDLGELSDEELESMPAMTEDNIDNFEFSGQDNAPESEQPAQNDSDLS